LPDTLQPRVDAVGAPVTAQGGAVFSLLEETLGHAAGGAEMVADTGKLTVRIGAWLKDAEARKNVAQTGLQAMEPLTGALERTVAALDPYLMQFGLERRVGQANSADNA